ncbi:MAG: hypothetical protein V1676_05780 [Candidatus Diapherotrites archaeon]
MARPIKNWRSWQKPAKNRRNTKPLYTLKNASLTDAANKHAGLFEAHKVVSQSSSPSRTHYSVKGGTDTKVHKKIFATERGLVNAVSKKTLKPVGKQWNLTKVGLTSLDRKSGIPPGRVTDTVDVYLDRRDRRRKSGYKK